MLNILPLRLLTQPFRARADAVHVSPLAMNRKYGVMSDQVTSAQHHYI